MESDVERLREQAGLLRHAAGPGRRVFTAGPGGEVVAVPRAPSRPGERYGALVVWQPDRRGLIGPSR
jgi:MerR family transcriptional regulator/heat shock protein HspR